MGKLKRAAEKYKLATKRDDSGEVQTQRLPKSQRLSFVQYSFITFKNCETKDVILDMMSSKSGLVQALKKCMGDNPGIPDKSKKLMGHDLDVREIFEPDDVIWDNLSYNADMQLANAVFVYVMGFFLMCFLIGATIYVDGVYIYVNSNLPDWPICNPNH